MWRIRDVLPATTVIHSDLWRVAEIADQMHTFRPEVIFHLAWQGGNSSKFQNDPAQVFSNVLGSLTLVRLAKDAGVQRWIGFGTSAEYGRYDTPVSENQIPTPTTMYGRAKYSTCLLTEKLCEQYGIAFVWIRPFWLYGPYDDPGRMIPYVIAAFLRGEEPALTWGEQQWDYLYIRDAVEAIWLLATGEQTGVFNLGVGQVYLIRTIVECIRDLIDPKLTLGLGRVPYGVRQVMRMQADISKLQKATGWMPRTTLENGLKQTVEWQRMNRYG
jgi:nucleoside-diphosphate-sugar epimerase